MCKVLLEFKMSKRDSDGFVEIGKFGSYEMDFDHRLLNFLLLVVF